MIRSEALVSWEGVRDVLARGIKLIVAMSALGLVLSFISYRHRKMPGVESALWQGGAFAAYVLLAGLFHKRYRAGENLVLAYAWAVLLAFWLISIVAFLIQAHWPEFLA